MEKYSSRGEKILALALEKKNKAWGVYKLGDRNTQHPTKKLITKVSNILNGDNEECDYEFKENFGK